VRKDQVAGSASTGFWLAQVARGHGFMGEALKRVVEHALDPAGLGFTRLRWESLEGNEASRRLAESVGFVFEVDAAHEVEFHGEPQTAIVGTMRSADGAGRL
jgi:RimJ/RimL family protein N-acetyltransferase